ncbi:hypothetical protein NKH77_33455 [Streptomyces sp. M19]
MTDAVRFYTDPTALVAAQKSLKFYADKGYSVTGKFRYYDQKVTLSGSGFGAELTYCGDESKGFASVRKTGKVLTTPVDKDSYVRYSALLRKNDKGVWQTASMSTDRGRSMPTVMSLRRVAGVGLSAVLLATLSATAHANTPGEGGDEQPPRKPPSTGAAGTTTRSTPPSTGSSTTARRTAGASPPAPSPR